MHYLKKHITLLKALDLEYSIFDFITYCTEIYHKRNFSNICFFSDSVSRKPLVVCLDIGTTYTGYAYSFIKKPDEITVRKWASEGTMLSPKAPSSVLLTPELSFHSFGYDAERKFSDLHAKNDHKSWNFVNGFKMVLNDKKVFVYFNMTNSIIIIFI